MITMTGEVYREEIQQEEEEIIEAKRKSLLGQVWLERIEKIEQTWGNSYSFGELSLYVRNLLPKKIFYERKVFRYNIEDWQENFPNGAVKALIRAEESKDFDAFQIWKPTYVKIENKDPVLVGIINKTGKAYFYPWSDDGTRFFILARWGEEEY